MTLSEMKNEPHSSSSKGVKCKDEARIRKSTKTGPGLRGSRIKHQQKKCTRRNEMGYQNVEQLQMRN
jgi:hypothetical protein